MDHGRKDKGISANELVLQTLSDGKPHAREELRETFAARGFAPTSTSPALTLLAKEGRVKKFGPHSYILGDVKSLKLGGGAPR